MPDIPNIINTYVNLIGFIPALLITALLGMFAFWRECKIVKKDNNSIFDGWILTSLAVAIWGRVAYIIAYPQSFENIIWFYLPYERFNGVVYLFRDLPWKYLAVWDGGFLFTAIAFIYLLSNITFISVIKKWSWKEMLFPVVISSQFMLALALCFLSILSNQSVVLVYSTIFLGMWTLFVIYTTLSRIYKYNNFLIPAIYTMISYSFVGIMFWLQTTNMMDKVNTLLFCMMAILIVYLYVKDCIKPVNSVVIEEFSSVRRMTITPNKAIKMGPLKK